MWTGYPYDEDDNEDPCEVGHQVVLNGSDYLGSYRNSDAEVTKVYNHGKLYDVKTYDGTVISVSKEHFDTMSEFYKVNKRTVKVCECGAKKVYKDKTMPRHHSFWCPNKE